MVKWRLKNKTCIMFFYKVTFVVFYVLFYCVFDCVLCIQPPVHNGRSFRNALNQQGIQTILQSIEERLRNLDQIYSVRYSQRSDINFEQYNRKMDILEAKLTRMENILEVQLEKLAENMSSKNLKEDISREQIFRKIDSTYDRLNHKLGFIEGKFDMDLLKLQSKIEAGLSKMDRLDHSISVRQADMELEISEGIESIKNSVANSEQKILNFTENLLSKNMENMSKKLSNFNLNCSSNQENFLNDFTDKNTAIKLENYGSKVNNMYNELWKKSINIENNLKNSIDLINSTQNELKQNINNLKTNKNDGILEVMIDSLINTIHKKFTDLGRKVEINFENVMLAQNLFLESCHRIQIDEIQLESKIGLILEKLLDSISNRSLATFNQMQNIEEIIKNHDNNIQRSMHVNTNTIIKLSEKTTEDRKKIEKILTTIKNDYENDFQMDEINEKLDNTGNILLDVQTQVNDLGSQLNKESRNYNNTKTFLQDLLKHTMDISLKQQQQQNIEIIISKLDEFLLRNFRFNNKLILNETHVINNNNNNYNSTQKENNNENIDIVLDILQDKKNINNTTIFNSFFNYSMIDDHVTTDIKNQTEKFENNPENHETKTEEEVKEKNKSKSEMDTTTNDNQFTGPTISDSYIFTTNKHEKEENNDENSSEKFGKTDVLKDIFEKLYKNFWNTNQASEEDLNNFITTTTENTETINDYDEDFDYQTYN